MTLSSFGSVIKSYYINEDMNKSLGAYFYLAHSVEADCQ